MDPVAEADTNTEAEAGSEALEPQSIESPPESPATPQPKTEPVKEPSPKEDKKLEDGKESEHAALERISTRLSNALKIDDEIEVIDDKIEAEESKIETARDKLKTLKNDREEKIEQYRAAVRGDSMTQPGLPFEEQDAKQAEAKKIDKPAEVQADEPAPVAADDKSWREVTLDEFGVTKPKMLEGLTKVGLTTMGAISDYIEAGKDFSEIPRFGAAAKQTIKDLMAAYFEKHPREGGSVPVAEERKQVAKVVLPIINGHDVGIQPSVIEERFEPDLHQKVVGGDKPKVYPIDVVIDGGASATYVVMSKSEEIPDAYILVKTYSVLEGIAANAVNNEGDEIILSPKPEDSILMNCGREAFSVLNFGFKPGRLAEICKPHLLIQAPYSDGDGDPPLISETVSADDKQYVVTQPPVKYSMDYYALRLLVPKTDLPKDENDPFLHRQVKVGSEVMEIGPDAHAIIVRDV